MSDAPQGPGWWQASDGRWYPPTAKPETPRPPTAPGSTPYGPAPSPHGPSPYGPSPYGPGPAAYGYGYAPNPNGTPSGLPSVNGYATASLVLGILSLVGFCCGPLVLCSLAGLPLGIYALTRINRRAADPSSRGLAIAGTVISGIGVALLVLLTLFLILGNS